MKIPRIRGGPTLSVPQIGDRGGVRFPHIKASDRPLPNDPLRQTLRRLNGKGLAYMIGKGVVGLARCPNVTSFPTISTDGGVTGAFDPLRRIIFLNERPASGIGTVSTMTNTFLASYPGASGFPGNTFGSYGIAYDPVSNMVVVISQAHGWSTFDPSTGAWTLLQGTFTIGMPNNAGGIRYVICDTKRGHTLFFGYVTSGPSYYEVVSSSPSGVALVQMGSVPEYIFQNPAYSAAADKFLLANGNGSSPPFYYMDPVSWALTPSSIVSSISVGGAEGMQIGVADDLGVAVFKDQFNHTVIVDVINDVLITTDSVAWSFPLVGCAYNSCKDLLYVTDGARMITYDPSAGYAQVGNVINNLNQLFFDPYSNLTYGLRVDNTVLTF